MLILFDVDDTLLDDTSASCEAVDELRDQLGLDLPLSEFRSRWFESSRRHFTRYLAGEVDFCEQRRARIRDAVAPDLSDAESDHIFGVYLGLYESKWRLFADVRPCLDALANFRLGIVSNGNAEQQRKKLSRFGILDKFSCVVVSEECGFAKPDPRIFARACELASTPPATVVHVGDRLDLDAIGATRAGLRALWLDRHGDKIAQPLEPSVTRLATLAELPELVERWATLNTARSPGRPSADSHNGREPRH